MVTQHSIIATQIASTEFREQAFIRGIELAQQSRDFANSLFQLRTKYLIEDVSGDDVHSYASGFLIGSEIQAVGASGNQPPDHVYLCGSLLMNLRYQRALKHFGIPSCLVDADQATTDGFMILLPHICNV